ncbi:MAG: hypothetical protein M3088_06590 [Actinomycetota bacterium]|nr:hypothetical protein [Actinomycetota bacterium]
MRQPIGSLLHGVLDYLTGVGLIGASRLSPLRGRFAGRALAAAGANHLAYSLVTDYELGVVKRLPYKAHLALDGVGALGLAAAPWLAGRKRPLDRWVPLGVAVYELSALALSDPDGRGRAGDRTRHRAVTVERPEDEVRAFLEDPAAVGRFAPAGGWPGSYELRPAPGGRGVEIHAESDQAVLRRAKQLLEGGEIVTAEGTPAGRRGPVSAALPTLDSRA